MKTAFSMLALMPPVLILIMVAAGPIGGNPLDVPLAITRASFLEARGGFDQAAILYERLVDHVGPRPDMEALAMEAHRNAGLASFTSRDFRTAMVHFAAADRGAPHMFTQIVQAVCLQKLDTPDAALQLLKTTAAQFPRRADPLLAIANLLAITGEFERAEGYYREAAVVDPGNPLVYINHGDALRWLNRKEEARRLYEKALEVNQRNPEAHLRLAEMALAGGMTPAEVQRHLAEVRRHRPDHPGLSRLTAMVNGVAAPPPATTRGLVPDQRVLFTIQAPEW
ncbi:tetratricopeptide repeat protein [bacterium]|nr:tetratricopeptide repeat protein [candidate division CSSED10-310 bacterium]